MARTNRPAWKRTTRRWAEHNGPVTVRPGSAATEAKDKAQKETHQ